MNAIKSLLQLVVNLSVCALICTAVVFTFLNPPPKSAPTIGTVEWKEDASASTQALAWSAFAMTSWKVNSFGPIALAEGQVPLTNEKLRFVGVGGRWYIVE